MSNRKNYNSIVFLTVYLGLVLVGASPQILAQAATASRFEVKNEIVVEDDLDKKPDDDEKIDFARSLDGYFNNVEDFIEDLQKLNRIEELNLDFDTYEVFESSFVPCQNGTVVHSIQDVRINDRWLEAAITGARYAFENYGFLSDCQNNGVFDNALSTNSKFKLSYDKAELKLEISAPKSSVKRAEFLAEQFNQASKVYKVDEDEPIVKIIHQNTSFKSENNQVFIVTRLPRAAIDDLLAEKDAQ